MEYDIINSLNGLNLNYLSNYSSVNYLETILFPSAVDEITQKLLPQIIVAQIIDNTGGIQNLTLELNVLALPPSITDS
jgi:hypothetical protein